MKLEWRGRALFITWLPVTSMGRLAALAPATPAETEVLAALLAGAPVYLSREALEYRRYRATAPPGVYRGCIRLERRLRELGVSRAPGKEDTPCSWDRWPAKSGPPKNPPPSPVRPF